MIKPKSPNYYKSSLKIACWNVQGLLQDKHQEEDIVEFVERFDCTILIESWLNACISFNNVYTYCKLAQKSRRGRSMAGFIITIKHSVREGITILQTNSNYLVWLKFKKSFFNLDKDMYIGAVYIPPVKSSTTRTSSFELDLWDQLEEDLLEYKAKGHVMIMGDFNSRIGKNIEIVEYSRELDDIEETYDQVDLGIRNSYDIVVNKFGRKLLELCRHLNLYILNGRVLGDLQGNYTSFHYNGSAVVDYCITDRILYNRVSYFRVHAPSHLSDHAAISVCLNINYNITQNCNISQYKVFPNKFKWCEESFLKALELQQIKCKLSQLEKDNYDSNTSGINKLCGDLSDVFLNTAKYSLIRRKNQKLSKRKQRHKKWYNNNLCLLKNEVLHTGKLLRKHPNDPQIRGTFLLKKKRYKQACKQAKRNYMKSVTEKIDQAEFQNNSNFWRLLKSINQDSDQESDLPSMEDFMQVFNKKSVDGFDNNFKCEIENTVSRNQSDQTVQSLDKPIDETELYKAVNNIKNGKACGLDLISNEMIKAALPVVKQAMLKLFNLCLDSECYPESWCTGYIVPIHKSGSKLQPSNYRPVTISSCLGKVFGSILNNRINSYLENNNLISSVQIGFLKGHRTSDHLLLLKAIIDSYKRKGKHIYASFIDFASAFDKVWHAGLIYKMHKCGLSSKIVNLVQSMYSKIQSCIKRENYLGELFKCEMGTRQGCNLSPTLFKLYINDIQNIFNKRGCDPAMIDKRPIGCLMYADDILVLSQSSKGLQTSLNNLNKYCKRWRLPININKSKTMVFNSRKCNNVFKIGDQILQDSCRVPYLGFILTPSGKFSSTQKYLYDKASRALIVLRKTLFKVPELAVKTQLRLFDSMIKPILLYGSEVWGAYLYKMNKTFSVSSVLEDTTTYTEKLHSKFCRLVLQIKKNACNYAVRCELGRYPIVIDIICKVLKYYVNIGSRDNKSISKVALMLHESDNSAWFDFIKSIANLLNISLPKLNKHNISSSKDSVRNKLIRISGKMYINKLQEYNRLKLFSSLKTNFCKEPYLSKIKDMKLRKVVTQLRLSCHRLPVEEGRYFKIEYNERICKLCKMTVGTEKHCIIECINPTVTNLRNIFLSTIFRINPSLRKLPREYLFQYLILFTDNTIMLETAQYISNILSIF
jgi:exonuclease III